MLWLCQSFTYPLFPTNCPDISLSHFYAHHGDSRSTSSQPSPPAWLHWAGQKNPPCRKRNHERQNLMKYVYFHSPPFSTDSTFTRPQTQWTTALNQEPPEQESSRFYGWKTAGEMKEETCCSQQCPPLRQLQTSIRNDESHFGFRRIWLQITLNVQFVGFMKRFFRLIGLKSVTWIRSEGSSKADKWCD